MKVVWVRWLDIYHQWESAPDKLAGPAPAESVGIVVRDDKDILSIAGSHFDDGDWRCVTHIPRGCVLEVKPLATLKPRKKSRGK